jgi:hypothetical protein
MRFFFTLLGLAWLVSAGAQELYVFSEPASNMPARAAGLKYAAKLLDGDRGRTEQRHMIEMQLGLSKKWMTHVSTSFSDMYSNGVRWESARIYTKYRFISIDDVHRHFRAAAFGELSYSVNYPMYDELSLEGDQSGARAGVILTQLLHKLALSSTLSYTASLQDRIQHIGIHSYTYNALNYSLSAGYLLFPRKYNGYGQTNFNLYLEMLGSRALDKQAGFLDLAPAVQFIFSSNTKLNLGYRFQVSGDMERMAESSFLISIERTFLNALKSKSP